MVFHAFEAAKDVVHWIQRMADAVNHEEEQVVVVVEHNARWIEVVWME